MCECCGQDTSYIVNLDHGTAKTVYQIAQAIKRKGINIVHPRKELEGSYITSNQVGNLSKARFHGLIASVRDNPGNYLLTTKGSKFLKNEPVAKFAIVKKATHKEGPHNIGYHMPEELITNYKELINEPDYWNCIDFDIVEGRIVKDIPKKETLF